MSTLYEVQKFLKKIFAILGVCFALILLSFLFHVLQVNKYNNTDRTITGDSVTMEVTADIHPRGLITDSWEKNDAFPDKIIYAKIYEGTITNYSQSVLTDWTLRINIKDDCYINNGWNGQVEIHQFINGVEKSQVVDLRNYREEDIKLDHFVAGQDLLIPLKSGDYLIYYPDTKLGEMPLKSSADYAGETNIGLIMYSLNGDVDLTDFEMSYHIHKSYFAGKVGMFFLIILPVWIGIMAVGGIISWIVLGFEGQLFIQKQMLDDTFLLCATVADAKDYYHKEHSLKVAKYSKLIAEHMGMDSADCESVYYSALLHNIGNYAVPEKILSKPTKLTDEERKVVHTHTVKGAQLLENVKSIPHAAEAAMYHHERYDGTGYPTGKKENEIPLVARIISIADAFDNMNRDKVYRKKYSREKIREEFKNNSGTQFDPIIVDVFLSAMDEIED